MLLPLGALVGLLLFCKTPEDTLIISKFVLLLVAAGGVVFWLVVEEAAAVDRDDVGF